MVELSAAERRSQIAQMVLENKKVFLSDLVKQYQISETSIRKDLTLLEEGGRLKRVHGGAVALPGSSRTDSFNEKMQLHIAAKQSIGKVAAQMICAGDVLLLDSGTTTLQVVMQIPAGLRADRTITVVTNSFPISQVVLEWPSPDLIMLGGVCLPEYQATVGPQTLGQLRELTADRVFLGVDGLTLEGGATTANILMAEVDRLMAERSRQVVLTDSSKLGRAGFVPIKPINAYHRLITDTNASPEFIDQIRLQGVEVILV
jgi:DeoR family transcriptional regulator of aga operon